MSHDFPQFQSLPRELQLMVFEEFLAASLQPRIVCLDTEERPLSGWSSHLLGWGWRVSNRGPLYRESPAVVATTLLEVNDTARYAANQFLDRSAHPLVRPFNPARADHALVGLGLCLLRDVFWLPDGLVEFVITSMGPPLDRSPTIDENISNIMISLEPFQEALHWATQPGHGFREPHEFVRFLKLLLINVLDSFPAATNLIIMVDVSRGQHIAWDQIDVVRGGDPDLWRLRAGGDGRYHTLYERYEALSQELVEAEPRRNCCGRALPKLSFAFRRPVRAPPRLTIV